MYGHRFAAAALMVFAGATLALACGPFFPWQLLDNRNETLKATPVNGFVFEASHIAPAPRDRMKPVEFDSWTNEEDRAAAFGKSEAQGLNQFQAGLVQKMREATNGDAAYAAGDGLPDAVRLYTAGAVAFRNNDTAGAAQRFAAVLALPPDRARARAVWALYMLGRIDAASNNEDKAASEFGQVRALVMKGDPDPLGLGIASYGAEAKLHFDRANAYLAAGPRPAPAAPDAGQPAGPDLTFAGYSLPAANSENYRSEMAHAASLYAQQAAHGSDSGVQSLRIIAENMTSDPSRIAAGVPDPGLQRLMIVFVLARIYDNATLDAMKPDAGTREKGVVVNPLLPAVVDAIVNTGQTHPAFADRLAALCYRTGRYDLAEKMAALSGSPLAHWVEAKLAIQKGDLAGAEKQYALASRGFPSSLDADNAKLIRGERGVVALARGEYLDALDKLMPVADTYWGDVAHISERVLTTDELKSYVDARVPAPAPAKASSDSPPPAAQLRDLLARRLMREQRYEEADPYFRDPATRKAAASYVSALHDGDSDWGRVDRAEALFHASVIARQSGMEVMGTETEPDYADFGGSYDTGAGQTEVKGPFTTAGERKRFAASVTKPDLRYHYRYIAVDEANRAADLLPPRSQAFAAVLCAATHWMMETPGEQPRVKAIYHRYLKQGPYVRWGKQFGVKCPAPDFAGAIYLERIQPFRDARQFVSRHRWPVLAAAIVVLLAGGLGILYALGRFPIGRQKGS